MFFQSYLSPGLTFDVVVTNPKGERLNGEVVHPLTGTKANYGCAGDQVYKV